MGSVVDTVKCERCGGKAHNDFNYRSREEYQICNTCGAGFSYTLKRDENRKLIMGEDGLISYDSKERVGNGVAVLMFDNHIASLYAAPNEVDKINEWKEEVFTEIEENPNIVKEESYVTVWDHQKDELVVVYGVLPKNEFEESEENDDVGM